MHREISHADRAFGETEGRPSLYALTALVGIFLLADVWPFLATWIDATFGTQLPSWPNEYNGYRLALIAALLGAARVLFGSIDSLLQGKLGADLALAVAVFAAIFIREPLVAAEVVFIGLLGECLEDYTFARTQQAIRQLAELTPKRCWRLKDGQEERILVSELKPGDVVVVKPGAKVPCDGVVREGRSSVNVSALTGEPNPFEKGPGDEVLAGSLNGEGALTIDVKTVGEHTVAGRVVELTARALKEKAPLERSADALARLFLPLVLGTAAVTFLGAFALHAWGSAATFGPWPALRYAVYPALSVLVVACPCALILATPAAVIAALGRLAGTGILVKGGAAIERLASVDAFAFDKTGTLTEGRLSLGDVLPLGENSADQLVALAAAAERYSEHPIARLIVNEATKRSLEPPPADGFTAHPGAGVTVSINQKRVLVGTLRLLQEQGVPITPEAQALVDQLDASGQTVLLVARGDVVEGAIGARDRVRDEAKAVIEELRRLGIVRVAMLTGDRAAAARPVAEALNIIECHAGLLPQDKAEFVAGWQEGKDDAPPAKVAMVGDGINDAPALARATVGLAIGGTADVAAEAGDVVLMVGPMEGEDERPRSPLTHLPFLLRLSRETTRIIRQNILVFAFGVNIAGVVLTAWLWPLLVPANYFEQGPLAAVLYHQIGSLLVLMNSMRLLAFERDTGPTWEVRVKEVNRWMEKRFDFDEALHWVGHNWQIVAGCGAGLVLMIWLWTGCHVIAADEVGVGQVFGKVTDARMGPGLHLMPPWPIGRVTRVQPGRVRTVEIGYRLEDSGTLPGGRSWASPHGGDGVKREAEEGVLITGDGNLLEAQGSVLYTIANPRVYLLEVARPEHALRSATEAALRELAGSRAMSEMLTQGRAKFQRLVQEHIEARGVPEQLGIKLEGVALHDLHPPLEVVPAYHDVTRAMEHRKKLVNAAEEWRTRRVRSQQADSEQVIRRAEADKFEAVRHAKARRAEFLSRHASRAPPWRSEAALALRLIDAAMSDADLKKAVVDYRAARRSLLEEAGALTDFRLYWDTLSASLTGRAKLLIDAEKLPVRRSLWLLPIAPPAPPPAPRARPAPSSTGDDKSPRTPEEEP